MTDAEKLVWMAYSMRADQWEGDPEELAARQAAADPSEMAPWFGIQWPIHPVMLEAGRRGGRAQWETKKRDEAILAALAIAEADDGPAPPRPTRVLRITKASIARVTGVTRPTLYNIQRAAAKEGGT